MRKNIAKKYINLIQVMQDVGMQYKGTENTEYLNIGVSMYQDLVLCPCSLKLWIKLQKGSRLSTQCMIFAVDQFI